MPRPERVAAPPVAHPFPPRPPLPDPERVTPGPPHVRDALDVRRAMRWVLVAVAPAALVGVWNAGFQALAAARGVGLEALPGWRGALLQALGVPVDPGAPLACLATGLAQVLPLAAVAGLVGWLWERIFSRRRGGRRDEALPVVVTLFVLILPPTLPLWQAALGVSFAVVVGLEIFGGTGRNVVNPALAGLAFLTFAYPASFSGGSAWVAVPETGRAPVLATVAGEGMEALRREGVTWLDTLLGREVGAIGETSALACLVGALLLVGLGLASGRVLAGGVAGLVATAVLAGLLGDPARPELGLPWSWHLTSGSFAFGLAFLATDPVTSAATPAGRLLYGATIGFLVVLVRVFNPAYSEGVVMAILLANVLAPLYDHGVVRWQLRRRRRRLG